MKKILLFLMFLILSLTSLAERFVVSSKDGYANLRRGTTINSEILDVLDNGEYVTKLDEVGEWYRVEYAAFDGGYIHKGQLKKYTK